MEGQHMARSATGIGELLNASTDDTRILRQCRGLASARSVEAAPFTLGAILICSAEGGGLDCARSQEPGRSTAQARCDRLVQEAAAAKQRQQTPSFACCGRPTASSIGRASTLN
jgi:hypothetical protein